LEWRLEVLTEMPPFTQSLEPTAATLCTLTKCAKCDRAKVKRGVDLISDALPFGRLWYGVAGNVIERHERTGEFKDW
jgi:hypothetical protein